MCVSVCARVCVCMCVTQISVGSRSVEVGACVCVCMCEGEGVCVCEDEDEGVCVCVRTVIWLYFTLKIFRTLLFRVVLISYAPHIVHVYETRVKMSLLNNIRSFNFRTDGRVRNLIEYEIKPNYGIYIHLHACVQTHVHRCSGSCCSACVGVERQTCADVCMNSRRVKDVCVFTLNIPLCGMLITPSLVGQTRQCSETPDAAGGSGVRQQDIALCFILILVVGDLSGNARRDGCMSHKRTHVLSSIPSSSESQFHALYIWSHY